MMDPSGVVRTILMLAPLLFEASSTFRVILLVGRLEVSDEVSQDLAFDCCSWLVSEFVGPQL